MIISKILMLFQLIYSVVVSLPLVAAFRLGSTRLASGLATPLLSGPFSGTLIDQIWDLICALQTGRLDQETFISHVAERMQEAYETGELIPYLQMADERSQNLDITLKRCLGFLPLKWWYLKLHFMAPGNVHDLHRHHATISAQVILRGELLAEQFNLVAFDAEGTVRLQPVPAEFKNGYQALVSTERYCNVHGFEPGPSGAVRFQFYLRGHHPLWKCFPKRGRHYIHLAGRTDPYGLVLGRLGRTGRPGES